MQQTIDPTSEAAQARCNFERFSERVLHLLSFVPDDKLAWTPSPTAKSTLHVITHCALTNRAFANIITGSMPEPMPAPPEFLKGLHEIDTQITTRESILSLVKETSAELCKAINTVNADNISSIPDSPFSNLTMRFWLNATSEHMAGHIGQLEYLQTIWGDMDNHFS